MCSMRQLAAPCEQVVTARAVARVASLSLAFFHVPVRTAAAAGGVHVREWQAGKGPATMAPKYGHSERTSVPAKGAARRASVQACRWEPTTQAALSLHWQLREDRGGLTIV